MYTDFNGYKYPTGTLITRVSYGINKGKGIIDLVYDENPVHKVTYFSDIENVVLKHKLYLDTKIFLRKDRTFEFQPIKDILIYRECIYFIPY